ncbi:Uu.00g103570.m01.CDS01 [Anthostomella pinea]|uniref:Uu.00g103570.m01.CDS01 n=1 Tax=Anthostomella pinea TaxID=933095 RepID=A0AAI8VEA5_9PEZI|nr:Uu.00g103570.m01.CDS01 [Anthostomella pinea]
MPGMTYTKALVGFAAFAVQVNAFWKMPCSSPVVVERADPIIDPGAISGHVHTILGSNAFNFTMDYASTQTATCSTCKAFEDLSSYWVPTLYYHAENGSFIPVQQSGGALVYYLQRTDPKDPKLEEGLLAFPKDFRMIAGDMTRRNTSEADAPNGEAAASFVCLGLDGPKTPELPKQNCPGGLRAQINFPSCWNGVDKDSPDHKSHVAYPSRLDTGYCPDSHPHRFITLFYEVIWSVDPFKDMWYGDGQPFVFSYGDPTGTGYHGDFVNGWDVDVLQTAINTCNSASGVVEECGAFTFRKDDDMKACKALSRVDEPITGVLAALPGCNPVQTGPETAQFDSSCTNVVKEIGDPIMPYTDMTKQGWKYVACAKDPQGQSRTLDGATSADTKDMTVDKCIKLCGDAGFTYAGLEYYTQCFCGDTLDASRMPTNGTMGDCSYPCSGDPTQLCGGGAQVAVYTKCAGGDCTNADVPDLF